MPAQTWRHLGIIIRMLAHEVLRPCWVHTEAVNCLSNSATSVVGMEGLLMHCINDTYLARPDSIIKFVGLCLERKKTRD